MPNKEINYQEHQKTKVNEEFNYFGFPTAVTLSHYAEADDYALKFEFYGVKTGFGILISKNSEKCDYEMIFSRTPHSSIRDFSVDSANAFYWRSELNLFYARVVFGRIRSNEFCSAVDFCITMLKESKENGNIEKLEAALSELTAGKKSLEFEY